MLSMSHRLSGWPYFPQASHGASNLGGRDCHVLGVDSFASGASTRKADAVNPWRCTGCDTSFLIDDMGLRSSVRPGREDAVVVWWACTERTGVSKGERVERCMTSSERVRANSRTVRG